MKINHNSTVEIKRLLKELNIYLKKRWGQNFLINESARNKIVDLLNPEENDKIWEIGPGIGSMTELLLARTEHLTVFEIDYGLIRFLEKQFSKIYNSEGKKKHIRIVQGDFLKTWKKELDTNGAPDKIISNLPFSSASAFIFTMIKNIPTKMVFTVQKELARRITAKINTKSYSSFSVLCQYACNTKLCGDLQSGSFFPRPEVTSTIIEITPQNRAVSPPVEKILFNLVRGLFQSRRKTIRNNILKNIKNIDTELAIKASEYAGIDLTRRAESYSIEDFIRFSEEIYKLINPVQLKPK